MFGSASLLPVLWQQMSRIEQANNHIPLVGHHHDNAHLRFPLFTVQPTFWAIFLLLLKFFVLSRLLFVLTRWPATAAKQHSTSTAFVVSIAIWMVLHEKQTAHTQKKTVK